jgi:hypothetical protein
MPFTRDLRLLPGLVSGILLGLAMIGANAYNADASMVAPVSVSEDERRAAEHLEETRLELEKMKAHGIGVSPRSGNPLP